MKKAKKTTSSIPIKIMIKLSWNNRRVPISSKITKTMTLVDILENSQDDEIRQCLYKADEEFTILYMRNSMIDRCDWGSSKIVNVVGADDFARGGSILLTLNRAVPKAEMRNTHSVAVPKIDQPAPTIVKLPDIINKTNSEKKSEIIPPHPTPTIVKSQPEQSTPMEIDEPPKTAEASLDLLFKSHFTAELRECILTIIKIIDNILSKPNDERTRCIRINNSAFYKKVASKQGAIEFLECIGFTRDGFSADEKLVLKPEKEDSNILRNARKMIMMKGLYELQMSHDEFPSPPFVPKTNTTTTSSNPNQPFQHSSSFDPYRSQSYNTQAASVAGANANTSRPFESNNYVSPTERQLNALNSKKDEILKSNNNQPFERNICAFSAQQQQHNAMIIEQHFASQQEKGPSDSALIAQRFKKMDEDRKKRENAGFTTKAMRDLEKLKKEKLYKIAQLRIIFPDGISLSCQFKPNETLSKVKEVIRSTFSFQDTPDFQLFITPPKQFFNDLDKSLAQEQLIPAAKLFVSWNTRMTKENYIKTEFFKDQDIPLSVPQGQKIVEEKSSHASNDKKNAKRATSDVESKEEMLLRKMMGSGATGSKPSSSSNKEEKSEKKKDAKWKPKWFKG